MPEETLVSDWSMEWFEKHVDRSLSQNTEGSYRQWIYRYFVPWFSDTTWNSLTEANVREFCTELADEGLSQAGIWCGHLLLRRILDEAGRKGLLEVNPAAQIDLSPQAKPEPGRFRRGQIKRCLEEAGKIGAYPILYTPY